MHVSVCLFVKAEKTYKSTFRATIFPKIFRCAKLEFEACCTHWHRSRDAGLEEVDTCAVDSSNQSGSVRILRSVTVLTDRLVCLSQFSISPDELVWILLGCGSSRSDLLYFLPDSRSLSLVHSHSALFTVTR